MSKTRSPNYPSIDLETALEAVRPVFKEENRNKFSRLVLAQHLNYTSLNGRALGKIGAVRAYGLIEGSGDDLRLSDDAITALSAPGGSADRFKALERCALKPALFQELNQEYQGLPSENNLRFWLIKRHFTEEAAGKAASTYLSTMRLVSGSKGEYGTRREGEVAEMQTQDAFSDFVQSEGGKYPPPRVVMSGRRLDIQATVDLEGLKKLQTMLEKYEDILKMQEPEK